MVWEPYWSLKLRLRPSIVLPKFPISEYLALYKIYVFISLEPCACEET